MKHRLWLAIILVIAALLGLLTFLHSLGPDREALRARFAAELQKTETLESVAKDKRLEELMADEDCRTHARALWLKAEKLHGPAHAAAAADLASRKAVPPFLARCADLSGKSPDDLRALDDEARALQNEHGNSGYGPALAELRTRLASGTKACSDLDHFRIQQEAQKERLAGKFAAALARIDEAIAAHPKCDLTRLRQEREALLKSASAAAEKLLRDRKAEALERALPEFKGLPDEGRIRALLKELKRP